MWSCEGLFLFHDIRVYLVKDSRSQKKSFSSGSSHIRWENEREQILRRRVSNLRSWFGCNWGSNRGSWQEGREHLYDHQTASKATQRGTRAASQASNKITWADHEPKECLQLISCTNWREKMKKRKTVFHKLPAAAQLQLPKSILCQISFGPHFSLPISWGTRKVDPR